MFVQCFSRCLRNQTRTRIVFRISGQTQSVKRVQNPRRSREKMRYFNQPQNMWLTNIVTKLSSYEVNMICIQNPYWELLVGGGFKYVFIFTLFGFQIPILTKIFQSGLVQLPTREENLSPGKVKFHHRFITRFCKELTLAGYPKVKG